MFECLSVIYRCDHLEPYSFRNTDWGRCKINHLSKREVCCTPKFSLPYSSRFVKIDLQITQNCSRGCTVQIPPKPVEIRVLVLSRNLGFSMVQSSLIGLYISSSTHIPSFKTHSANLHSPKPHLIHRQLQE